MRILFAVLLLLSVCPAFGDDRPDKHGIYRISAPDGSAGTCFVVKLLPGRTILATAGHVVCKDDAMQTIHSAGYDYTVKRNDTLFVGKVRVLMVAADSDTALVEGQFDANVEVMEIDPDPVPTPKRDYTPPRKPASVLGYGAGKWLQTTGFLSLTSGQYVHADCVAAPGQSGGPVVADGKVVGVCSGGSFWMHDDPDKKTVQFTWPLRAGSGKRLKQLVDSVK